MKVKRGGSKIVIKAFKSWDKVLGHPGKLMQHKIYLYSLVRVYKHGVGNGKLVFAAPIGLGIST